MFRSNLINVAIRCWTGCIRVILQPNQLWWSATQCTRETVYKSTVNLVPFELLNRFLKSQLWHGRVCILNPLWLSVSRVDNNIHEKWIGGNHISCHIPILSRLGVRDARTRFLTFPQQLPNCYTFGSGKSPVILFWLEDIGASRLSSRPLVRADGRAWVKSWAYHGVAEFQTTTTATRWLTRLANDSRW